MKKIIAASGTPFIQLKWSAAERDLHVSGQNFFNKTRFEQYSLIMETAPKDATVLDLGSGGGSAAFAFGLRGFNVHAVDWNPHHKEMMHLMDQYLVEPQITFEKNTVTEVTIEPNTYGAIILSNIVYFLSEENVVKLIEDSSRGLKPGGSIFMVGFDIQDSIRETFKQEIATGDAEYVTDSSVKYKGKGGRAYHRYLIDPGKIKSLCAQLGLRSTSEVLYSPSHRYNGSPASTSSFVFQKPLESE